MLFMLIFFFLKGPRSFRLSRATANRLSTKLEFNSHLGHAFYFISLLYILFVMLFCHLFTMKMKKKITECSLKIHFNPQQSGRERILPMLAFTNVIREK